eukprot:TRINITY_DN46_c1_g3_i1.p1 TRINITY_DN46_c1_g3~~TRINITY_DN46_c1_g3_i1.p1  ORF type:complete len:578 (+),score=126.16 TRINITY_DN46_c1_g3_i1:123-1856(+)
MHRYRVGDSIGSGCFGSVVRATYIQTGQEVAIKIIQNTKLGTGQCSGLPTAAWREMKALQRLQPHPHILRLCEAFPHGSHLCLVTELLTTDLAAVLRNLPGCCPIGEACAKTVMQQLLRGVAHMHAHGLMHRDLKPANLLITDGGTLRIADFGLTRPYRTASGACADLTHEVGTKWYRAVELLLGCRRYTQAVDLWSCGCILGEMLCGAPLFPGTTEIDQIVKIFQLLGSPTDRTWPQREEMPDWSKVCINPCEGVPLTQALPDASPAAQVLTSRFIRYNDRERCTAEAALRDAWFLQDPAPVHPEEVYLPPAAPPLPEWESVLADPPPPAEQPPHRTAEELWHPAVPYSTCLPPAATWWEGSVSPSSSGSSSSSASTRPAYEAVAGCGQPVRPGGLDPEEDEGDEDDDEEEDEEDDDDDGEDPEEPPGRLFAGPAAGPCGGASPLLSAPSESDVSASGVETSASQQGAERPRGQSERASSGRSPSAATAASGSHGGYPHAAPGLPTAQGREALGPRPGGEGQWAAPPSAGGSVDSTPATPTPATPASLHHQQQQQPLGSARLTPPPKPQYRPSTGS